MTSMGGGGLASVEAARVPFSGSEVLDDLSTRDFLVGGTAVLRAVSVLLAMVVSELIAKAEKGNYCSKDYYL